MSLWVDITRVAMGVNVLLLVALVGVWGRNYRQLRSKHTLGLLLFGLMLLGENALGLYYFMWHADLAAWFTGLSDLASSAMMALRLAETFAIAFLAWVTFD